MSVILFLSWYFCTVTTKEAVPHHKGCNSTRVTAAADTEELGFDLLVSVEFVFSVILSTSSMLSLVKDSQCMCVCTRFHNMWNVKNLLPSATLQYIGE
jgi:hypothetical protein